MTLSIERAIRCQMVTRSLKHSKATKRKNRHRLRRALEERRV